MISENLKFIGGIFKALPKLESTFFGVWNQRVDLKKRENKKYIEKNTKSLLLLLEMTQKKFSKLYTQFRQFEIH